MAKARFKRSNRKITETQSKKPLLLYIVSVFILITFLVIYVWLKVQKDNLVTDIQQLRREKTEKTREYYHLQVQIYELSSLQRIERIATEKLDMHYPTLDEEYKILEVEVPVHESEK